MRPGALSLSRWSAGAPTKASCARAARPEAEHGFRPDIQGLRAIAIALVVTFHLYPSLVPGGYVGVDVFFVISGYLITAHLARGLRRGERVRLLDFYGRRARRLLPAAALVLTATAVGSRLWLPVTQRAVAADQIRASALYFQNWTLARTAVDYFAQGQAASPVEQFWSLSVEEQFYLVWPLLFLAAAAAGALAVRRANRARRAAAPDRRPAGDPGRFARRATLLLLTTAVVVASLAYSISETAHNPATAYFVTPTRMWELGLGGLLALAPDRLTRRARRVGLVAWIGFAAILGSALTLSGASPFPGWIASIPVLGAAAMILCGSPAATRGPSWLTSSRPAVSVGDISYELYLWHWPLIVLWGAYSHRHGVGYVDGPVIIVGAVLVSWLTKRFVSDPVRTAHLVVRRPTLSLATAGCVAVPALLATGFLLNQPGTWAGNLDQIHPGVQVVARAEAGARVKAGRSAKVGVPAPAPAPAARTTPGRTPHTAPKQPPHAALVPPLTQVAHNLPLLNASPCELGPSAAIPRPCTIYDPPNPTMTVALVGDSHMSQWSSSLLTIAKKRSWKLIGDVHVACPWTAATSVYHGAPYTSCTQWGKRVLQQLVDTIKPDVVIVSDRPAKGTVQNPHAGVASRIQIGKEMVPYFRALLAHGIAVVAIHETPEPGRNIPTCLAEYDESIAKCSRPAAEALQTHTPIDVAHAALGSQLPVVNMNDLLCPGKTCPPAVGNVIIYRDHHHLTKAITRTMTPYLDQRLMATGAFAPRSVRAGASPP